MWGIPSQMIHGEGKWLAVAILFYLTSTFLNSTVMKFHPSVVLGNHVVTAHKKNEICLTCVQTILKSSIIRKNPGK
jgi:hypothetical protein